MAEKIKVKKTNIETLESGKYTDQNNLSLVVKPSGSRSWVFRSTVKGKRSQNGRPIHVEMGLGTASRHNIEDKRKEAFELLELCRSGTDPRSCSPKNISTFEEFATVPKTLTPPHGVGLKAPLFVHVT